VPAAALGETGRAAILHFYGEVFGWTEMPTLTVPGERLVLRAHSNEQFVFLVAADEPLRGPAEDHFGLSVPRPADLDEILRRARDFARRDPEVRIEERKTEDFGVVALHSFYVSYRLPLRVEVQCYEWREGFGPDRTA
jgi:hypothetical protein